jgi:hypothetical protein
MLALALLAGMTRAQQPVGSALPAAAVLRMGQGHVAQLAGLALLDNGRTLLTGAKDDTLRLYEGRRDGERRPVLKTDVGSLLHFN